MGDQLFSLERLTLGQDALFYLSDKGHVNWDANSNIIPEEDIAILITLQSLIIYSEVTETIVRKIKIT